jgi:general secretion pathway protein G
MNTIKKQRGFTLIELMIVLVIAAILAVAANSAYGMFGERARIAKAIGGIGEIHIAIQKYMLVNGGYPPNLAALGLAEPNDPWGNPYQFLVVEGGINNGASRKDKNLVPVNNYYDVYSMGKDGATSTPFNSTVGKDDVVMAGDGAYFGYADDH